MNTNGEPKYYPQMLRVLSGLMKSKYDLQVQQRVMNSKWVRTMN